MTPLLSILMPALEFRPWDRMLDMLRQQAEAFDAAVEILHELDCGEQTSGIKRQLLIERAKGRYVAYVDDDDEVAEDYIAQLVHGCRTGVDVVTFCLGMTRNGQRREQWQFGLYRNNRVAGLMCVNHLCAWRRDIASRVAWCPALGYADDQVWFQPLFAAGLVTSQYHVQKVLYHYLYSDAETANQRQDRRTFSRKYVGQGLRCFRDADGEILVEVGLSPRRADSATVRDRRNVQLQRSTKGLKHFHTITIN